MRSMHAFLTLLGEFIATHHARLRHFAKVACVILLCAAALEVVVFNFNHWRSLTWQPITANEQSNLQETADERLRISAIDNTIEFDYVGVPVHNIKLDFLGNQSAQNVPVKIWFTDDAHSTYFDDDEYTAGVPVTYVSTNNEESKYLNINASGSVYKLRIQVGIDDGETKVTYPLYLSKVVLNAPEPFSFRGERFLFAACIMALIYAFRPKSSLYRTQLREHPRRTKIAVIGVAAVEIWVGAAFLLLGTNLVGVATQHYNSGSWDGMSVVNVFECGGENAQQYAELAKSMTHGKLYLEEEPPNWLQNMDDPYDRGARDQLVKETGENYLWDTAYYEGHYYVYFGVVPVLLFYLPFYLVTGDEFPYGYRRAHRHGVFHRGPFGAARPLCPLPLQTHDDRRVPAAANSDCDVLRHAVFAEVPHVLFAAYYVGARVFGVGPVFLDGGSPAINAPRASTWRGRCAWRSW